MAISPQELILQLQASGTGEDKILYMERVLEELPDPTTEKFVAALETKAAVALGSREAPVVGQGTLRKIGYLVKGEPIPVERSRISASMLSPQNMRPNPPLPLSVQAPAPIGPVSASEPVKPPVQPIGPVSNSEAGKKR